MRRRLPLNLALAAVVVVLAALLWLNHSPPSSPQPITSLSPDAINRVTIALPEAETIRLARSASGWQLRAPVPTRARAPGVDQILRLARRESKHHMQRADVDPARIGLDAPVARVTFNETTIAIGARQPINNRRYVRVGDTIHLIVEPNMAVLDADYTDLVARRLLPKDVTIQRLELPNATITPSGDNGWSTTAEGDENGNKAAQKTVDAWRRTQALSVKPAGDATAKAETTIETTDHGTLAFEVLAREPQLLLRRPDIGATFHVAGNRVGPLLQMRHPEPRKLKGNSAIQLAPDED